MMAFTRRAQRTPERQNGARRLPARFGKRCRTSCREPPGRRDRPEPWSLRPSTYRRGNGSVAADPGETLKPHRALGPGEALVVVQITLVAERQAQSGPEFTYRGP